MVVQVDADHEVKHQFTDDKKKSNQSVEIEHELNGWLVFGRSGHELIFLSFFVKYHLSDQRANQQSLVGESISFVPPSKSLELDPWKAL